MLQTLSKDKWKRLGTKRKAGILVPLFSVYSQNSQGIGDFLDLKLLVDFCAKTGNSILQLLPMNEVAAAFCPYETLSSFALEPMYISLGAWAKKESFPASKLHVDYRVKKEKLKILWEVYPAPMHRCGVYLKEYDTQSPDLINFKKENAYWLDDFALYKVLKGHHRNLPWYEWKDCYKNRVPLELENFRREHEKEIGFQAWLQWVAFKQVIDAKKYAQDKKILLKGDLPIFVSRDSADVWSHPEFFKLEFAAGAPPDMYCSKGQRWGMPTYNWPAIAADNYRYLKEKLCYAENFYDILRIDHVVGLFRIWSIPYQDPLENQGLNGFFDPKDETKWEEQGRTILSTIVNNTGMLICAEDLGVIPKICPKVLEEFGIPGNDVQRWTKDWKIKHDFLGPKDYRYLSVAMLSTHDTTNWPAWYEFEAGTVDERLIIRKCADHRKINYTYIKDRLFDPSLSRHGRLRWLNSINSINKLVEILGRRKEELKDFIDIYQNTYQEKEKLWQHLKIPGQMREKCDAQILKAALNFTLQSRSIFCIQSLIDWLNLADIFKSEPYQYRINTPGTISEKNWSLTIPISLEKLLKHKVCKDIRTLIASSGRI